MNPKVEIKLARPLAVKGKKGQAEHRVSFIVSKAALHLLTGPHAVTDLELFAKPAPPPKPPAKPKGQHGLYWERLFNPTKCGLGYCGPLKDALKLKREDGIPEIKAALYQIFGVESLSFVSREQFKAWLTSIGIAPKVPH